MGLSLLCTIGIFFIHYLLPSLITAQTYDTYALSDVSHRIDHHFVEQIVEYHTTHPAFVRRPLVTGAIEIVHRVLDVSYAYGFIAVNFILLFLCGAVLYRVSRTYDVSHVGALVSVVLFYSSFSVLLAFTLEMSTYDDLLQYIVIWLALLYVMQQRWYAAVAALFLALWSRETTLLLIPGLLLFLYPVGTRLRDVYQHVQFKKSIYIIAIATICYLIVLGTALYYFGMVGQAQAYFVSERWTHLMFNFQNQQYALQSVASIMLVLGFPLFILGAYVRDHVLSVRDRAIIAAFLVSIVINTAVVLTMARAQEARLLALPLLFVWQLLGTYAITVFKTWWLSLRRAITQCDITDIRMWFYICHALFLLIVDYIICFVVFAPPVFAELLFLFRGYLFILFACVIIYYLPIQLSRRYNI